MKKYLLKIAACFALLLITNIIQAQTWTLTGNAGTIDGTNFIGTTDNKPINFRVNNQRAGRIDPALSNSFYGLLSGNPATTGGFNTAVGWSALGANTTGNYNTATGYGALSTNTTGNGNLALGIFALQYNTTGSFNSAIGYGALNANTVGTGNFANGTNALHNNISGIYNTASGYSALLNNTTGNYNIGIGYAALLSNTAGSYNTATGWAALYSNTTGLGNLAYGYAALRYNTTGSYNTATGYAALTQNYGGGYNSAYGYNALTNNVGGVQNTANGYQALLTNTYGNGNTALGFSADVATASLTNATAIGSGAIVSASNTIQLGNSSVTQVLAGTGTNATLVAGGLKITGGTLATGKVLTSDANGVATWQAPGNSTGWTLSGNAGTVDGSNFIGTTDNVPINFRVNNKIAGRIDAISHNTFYGYQTGVYNSSGSQNTANGFYALNLNTTGNENTANGAYALLSNTTGNLNSANGYATLVFNSTGGGNTANGYAALYFNTSGNNNVANGIGALYYNTSGGANTANGEAALYSNTTGGGNTADGNYALYSNYTGSDITALGDFADVNADGYSNATAIGANSLITGSNRIVLGNTAITGIFAEVTGITALSDGRYKKNIQQNVPGLDFIKLLKPITYRYDIKELNASIKKKNSAASQKENVDSNSKIGLSEMLALPPPIINEAAIDQKESIVYSGLVAQDVEAAAKKVNYDFSGIHKPQNAQDPYGLNYTDFVVPLIKSVQELSVSNDKLQNQFNNLTGQNITLQQQVNNLQTQNNDLQNQLNELKVQLQNLVKGGISSGSTLLSSAKLEQNIPNPFNQTTLINYYVPESAGQAFIKVTGMNGKEMKTVQLNGTGSGQLTLQTATLAAGNYTYSLYVDGSLIDTKVMVLAR